MHRILSVIAVVACLDTSLLAQAFVEDFEEGVGAASSYHKPPNDVTVEVGTDAPFSGKQYARAELPGKRNLEGFAVVATGLSGGRLATATARVRGRGELWLCLISRNGWLYSPGTVTLTGQWQEVSLSKVLVARDTTLGVNFLTRTAHAAVFEVDRIEVALAPELQVYDAEVGPWLLEAEDYAVNRATVAKDPDASGGAVCRAGRWLSLGGFPFPRTSRPVTVYAKVQSAHGNDSFRLMTTQGGQKQTLHAVAAERPNEWQWLAFGPLTAGEVGDSFVFELLREDGTVGDASVDCLVISTRTDLSGEELAAAAPLAAQGPLAVVARTETPPILDGKADDACWRHTVALRGFLGVGGTFPAQAETTVRLCYDATHLYAFFQCDEPILNVAQQRRHEFLATVTKRDGDVSGDDAVVMLLQAEPGGPVYDFTINALGTLSDAVCREPNLWAARDIAWNSNVQAQGAVGEDSWTVEMAIPWSDFGGAPQAGDAWRAVVGRLARARGETTSWNLSNRGLHDPVAMGRLVFGEATIGLTLNAPPGLQVGRNELTAAVQPQPGESRGLYLFSHLTLPAATQHDIRFAAVSGEAREETLTFDVPPESELQIAIGALDAASLQPLCLTPRLPRAVEVASATLRIACEGPYELHVNDELIGRGAKAELREINVPLRKGANVVVVKLLEGAAAVSLEAGNHKVGGEAWKMADDGPKTLASATDDGDWPNAAVVGPHPQLGAVVGRSGQPTVLRHTLLWQKTRIWPTPEPAFYLAQSVTSHVVVITDGLKNRRLRDWTTYLAVPPDYEVVGSTGFYGTTNEAQPQFHCTPLGITHVQGRPMRVVKVVADKPVLSGRHPIMSQFQAFVRYTGDAQPAENESEFLYWSAANGGSVTEAPQSFTVRLLPEVQGEQPKKLLWQLWGGWLSNMDDPSMREHVLAAAQKAGFNNIVGGDQWTTDRAPHYGMTHTVGINFEPWNVKMRPYLEQKPDARLIDRKGEPNDTLMCTTLLLADGWAAAEAALKERLDRSHPHYVDYDYEYGPANGPHSCYCPRCLSAFREFAALEAEAALDAAVIRSDYWPQWIDFMARRVAGVCLRFKESIHRLYPGTRFSVYSGYQTPENPERYGIDWRYIGDLQAADHAGCGYGRPVEAIAATTEALKGIPLVGGALLVPYDTTVTTPQTPLSPAWLLRVLLDSTGGVLVYERSTMDGRSWHAMGEVTRLTAAYEHVFLEGRRSELPGHDPAQVQVVAQGKTTLVCVLNSTRAPVDHRITLPHSAGAGREFYSGQPVTAGETVEVPLEPGQAAVYVLEQ
ncbi:MAG: hypothetical protein RBS80_24685 [Thermoguttaceae bacterium]|jgi:hypothetical protein|nr:hypothetical protein [Thermoguttaceae bacterium]